MTETTQIAEFNPVNKALVALREKWATTPDFTTKDGYEEGRVGIRELVKLRTGLDKKRLELNKDDQDRISTRNAEAKRITVELVKLEDPLKEAKALIDDEAERLREAKRAAEEQRIQGIKDRLAVITGLENVHAGMEMEQLEASLDALGDTYSNFDWQEFKPAADMECSRIKGRIEAVIGERKDFEVRQSELAAAEKKLEREREELAKIKVEEDAKREAEDKAREEKRVADQKQLDDDLAADETRREAEATALAEKQAEEQAKLDADRKAFDDEKAEAARIKQEADDKAEAEREAEDKRKADIKAEAERKVAAKVRADKEELLRPDRERFINWVDSLDFRPLTDLKSVEFISLRDKFEDAFQSLCKDYAEEAEAL